MQSRVEMAVAWISSGSAEGLDLRHYIWLDYLHGFHDGSAVAFDGKKEDGEDRRKSSLGTKLEFKMFNRKPNRAELEMYIRGSSLRMVFERRAGIEIT